MKKYIITYKVLLAALSIFTLVSCHTKIDLSNGIDGSGNVTRQTRNLNGFNRIDVNRGLNVIVEQSNDFRVEVEADDNLQSHITTKVENGTLIISTDENIDDASARNIYVKMPELTVMETSSGSTARSRGTLKGTKITVRSNSGSQSDLSIEFDNVDCESSSGSSVSLKGKALKLTTDSSSGSEINAKELFVNEVVSKSSSGSSTSVHPIVSLNGKATSGSSISYDSSPKNVIKDENSGGSVSKE